MFGDVGSSSIDLTSLYPIAYPSSPTVPTSASSSGFNWGSLIAPLANTATSILSSRYAVPQLNSGQVIQTPTGYMAQASQGGILPTGINLSGSGWGTMLLIGGGLLVVLLVASKK